MKIKKIIVILLALALLLCGCGKKIDPIIPPTDDKPIFDAEGNTYVDPEDVKLDVSYYKGMDSYLDKNKYGAFADVTDGTKLEKTDRPLNEMIGFVHAGGQYNFTKLPYLEEGASVIEKDLKSKTIKMWLTREMPDQYSFNHVWNNNVASLEEVAKDEYVKKVFNMQFSTIILVAYEYERVVWDSLTPINKVSTDYVTDEFYKLTKELLRAYNTTGKTFILQNWEGDNELSPALAKYGATNEINESKQKIMDNYLKYSNARQMGIAKARKEITDTDVKVYGALEVNFISSNYGKQPKIIDTIMPQSSADLFSFSDWSTSNVNLDRDLKTLKEKAPNNNAEFGDNNFYLGEYGRAENLSGTPDGDGQFSYSIETMKIALNSGARYVCYWALNCNERVGGESTRPANNDMLGFWLIKPDGHYTKTFWYYKGLLEDKNYLSGQPKLRLRLPEPEPEPIPFVEKDIIFTDNFDDVGLDGIDITKNKKWKSYSSGMQYDDVKAADRVLLRSYVAKYNIPENTAYRVVQKKVNMPSNQFIEYDVKRDDGQTEAKLVIQGYLYDPTPKSIIKVMVSSNGTDYEDIKSVYVMDKSGSYGYMYVTTLIPEKYKTVKIVFTNTKAANSWDPLVARVAFLK